MALCCTVCGEWVPSPGRDRLDICPACFKANFSGAQPPLDASMATAREALIAYTAAATPPTPRQVEVLRRLTERYLAQEDA